MDDLNKLSNKRIGLYMRKEKNRKYFNGLWQVAMVKM